MEGSQEMVWPEGSQLGVSITVSGGIENEAGGVPCSKALKEQPKHFGKDL